MSWRALTAGDIQTQISGDELDKLQTAALASGQTDPLPGIISQVTDEVRGYVGQSNPLGAGATLPPQVLSAAISIVRWRIAGRLSIGGNAALFQTEQRQKDYENALTFLQAVAKGQVFVEPPETEDANSPTVEGKWGSATQKNFGP